jgi:hypothetical protein
LTASERRLAFGCRFGSGQGRLFFFEERDSREATMTREAREGRTVGAMLADQMDVWNSYANLYREQSEKLLSLWMGQIFECQRESQRYFADWLKNVERTSTDFCHTWEDQAQQTARELGEGSSRGRFRRREQQERSGEA